MLDFTAVGHLVEELKAIRPELLGDAWVSLYPCMEEMSQKDLVTSCLFHKAHFLKEECDMLFFFFLKAIQ